MISSLIQILCGESFCLITLQVANVCKRESVRSRKSVLFGVRELLICAIVEFEAGGDGDEKWELSPFFPPHLPLSLNLSKQ
jgi:hypothetical protein